MSNFLPKELDSVKKRILSIMRSNSEVDFSALLTYCNGADPNLVNEAINIFLNEQILERNDSLIKLKESIDIPKWADARAMTIKKYNSIPSPNPLASQWWFDLDTVNYLAKLVWENQADGIPAFLGTPILAYFYACATKSDCTVLDVDKKLLDSLQYPENCTIFHYDIENKLPEELKQRHSVVVIDPPWYNEMYEAFLIRSRYLASPDATLLCVIPGLLTRPTILEERKKLIDKLHQNDYKVICIEPNSVSYIVPDFEAEAYKAINGFDTRSWRRADLIISRFPDIWEEQDITYKSGQSNIKDFNYSSYRIFFRETSFLNDEGPILEEASDFATTVSTRNIPIDQLGLWTSKKRGYIIRRPHVISIILENWAKGFSYDETLRLTKEAYGSIESDFDAITQELCLWNTSEKKSSLRKYNDLEELRKHQVSNFAASPSSREYKASQDPFRLEFQRDRDRITWSKALKKLSSKTQVFPVEHDDQLRRRLTHSMEVCQLALTIAKAFGFDSDLTEAIAIAHDVGHTPFGHAGEEAINEFFKKTNTNLGGFSHYEHGVDVLRWLEDAYISPGAGGYPGLNLCTEVYEGVFKHTYSKSIKSKSQDELYRVTKHSDIFDNTFCHLEGQAVRIADKISYLVEDLEDGIRARVLSLEQIRKCRLFSRSPIDLRLSVGETDLERFTSQRGAILNVLMTDVLEETERRLQRISSINDVRNAQDYTVKNSSVIDDDMKQVWRELQSELLHKNLKVQRANIRAAGVVQELLVLFIFCPEIIDVDFQRSFNRLVEKTNYLNKYRDRVESNKVSIRHELGVRFDGNLCRDSQIEVQAGGLIYQVPLRNLIIAKDFVASMTDDQAIRTYREFTQGEVPWR